MTVCGLNNGKMERVVSICYADNRGPPDFPECVVIDFPGYTGPHWLENHPTWVPIPLNSGRCENNCCSRQGFPLTPGYAIPIAKSQGMTIGHGKPMTHCRVKLQSNTQMESLNLRTAYVSLSRSDADESWALVEPIPFDRLSYIGAHPHMKGRIEEEKRLRSLSEVTVAKYLHYAVNPQSFIDLLEELDELCDDDLLDSVCVNSNGCHCTFCQCKES